MGLFCRIARWEGHLVNVYRGVHADPDDSKVGTRQHAICWDGGLEFVLDRGCSVSSDMVY